MDGPVWKSPITILSYENSLKELEKKSVGFDKEIRLAQGFIKTIENLIKKSVNEPEMVKALSERKIEYANRIVDLKSGRFHERNLTHSRSSSIKNF